MCHERRSSDESSLPAWDQLHSTIHDLSTHGGYTGDGCDLQLKTVRGTDIHRTCKHLIEKGQHILNSVFLGHISQDCQESFCICWTRLQCTRKQ